MSTKLLAETTIESLSHDGRGVALIDGKTTFVRYALPTETIRCKINKQHRRYNEAQATEIFSAAPDRVAPECPHFGICGGCSMQHLAANQQVLFKQQVLLDQLKHFGKVSPEKILLPIVGKPWGYRRKARLGVRYVRKKAKLLVGFREQASNYLADLTQCPILHPSVGTRLQELAELIQGLTQHEHIPQIEVAVSDDATALIFRHLTPLPEQDHQALCTFGKKHALQIYLQPNTPASAHKIWPTDQIERLQYALPDYHLQMHFHPLDFTQVNGEINRLMIKQAITLLDPQPTETVLDLFCGLGNFTLPLARFAKQVVGVEGSAEMVARATENMQANQITNAEFYAANLMDPTLHAVWLQKSYQKILLDPPRSGAQEIIPLIANKAAQKIVYVSCNPATLARDAGELVYNYGYSLKQVGAINMFPHTSHIEAIALFEK